MGGGRHRHGGVPHGDQDALVRARGALLDEMTRPCLALGVYLPVLGAIIATGDRLGGGVGARVGSGGANGVAIARVASEQAATVAADGATDRRRRRGRGRRARNREEET